MLLAAATPLAAQTAFEAALERAAIAMGDTVSLRLRAIGDLSGEPALSPLAKGFEIVDQTTWSSFDSASRNLREWLLVLAPRRSGRISIAALSLDGVSGSPLELMVSAAPRPAGTAAESLPSRPPQLDNPPVDARSPTSSSATAFRQEALAPEALFMEVEPRHG